MSAEKLSCKRQWKSIFKLAVEADTWGQKMEASEEYEKLERKIVNTMSELSLTPDEKVLLNQIVSAVQSRNREIQPEQSDGPEVSLAEVKKLDVVFKNLFEGGPVDFPINLSGGGSAPMDTVRQPARDDGFSVENGSGDSGGSLDIYIDKIGLKDAQSYIDAHITVSVVDKTGSQVLESQDTPNSSRMKPNYVTFEHNCAKITTDIDSFEKGSVLFFEFKHYKPKSKKVSTRCFTFMEWDEIVKSNNNMTCLELYKKPTQLKRTNLNLHTIKKLFLHVSVGINR